MEWFWDVLGIEATNQVYKVKQAYVNQVREYKQLEIKGELAENAYSRLDEAEKAAINYIEKQGSNTQQPVSKQADSVEKTQDISTTSPQEEELVEIVELIEEPEELTQEPRNEPAEVILEVTVPEEITVPEEEKQSIAPQEPQEVVEISPTSLPTAETKKTVAQPKGPLAVLVVEQIRGLLADWPRKITLSDWQTIFKEKATWERGTLVEIRDNSLPLLKEQLHLLPKEVLTYLYEVLEVTDIELTGKTNWFFEIDQLPDFSFNNALYMPEEECTTYFTKRYQLYQDIVADDWSSRRMTIDKLIAYFMTTEGWQADYDIHDHDILNLIAGYNLKSNIELFVKDPKARWFDEKLLLPLNARLASEKNKTAVYLRILFTTYRQQEISTGQALFIEDKDHNYFDRNLHELLVGLAFYSTGDQIKANKHFEKLTNEYRNLIKPLMLDRRKEPLRSKQPAKKAQATSFNFDGKAIWRVIVLLVVGFGLINNVFSNDDDYYDYDVEDEYEEELDWDYVDDVELGFNEYFFSKVYNSESYEAQSEYISNFVSEEAWDYFDDYREHYDEIESDWSDNYYDEQRQIHYKRLTDNTEAYLYSDGQQQDVILYVEDETTITRVVGEHWEEVDDTEYEELLKVFRLAPEQVADVLSQSYYLLGQDEREGQLPVLKEVVTQKVHQVLADDYAIYESSILENGTYQLSKNDEGTDFLIFNNQEGHVEILFELDEYGAVTTIYSSSYGEIDSEFREEIQKNASEKKALALPEKSL